jgi:cation:H+ antiporter
MLLSILLVVLGFVALIFGANGLVDGASALAKKFKVSDLIIGLTIVAFGTSAPELIVNLIASKNGYDDIIFGNILGSNNFNLFIILGIAALIYPITVQYNTIKKEIPIALFLAVLVFVFTMDFSNTGKGVIARFEGLILLLVFAAFLFYLFKQSKELSDDTDEIQTFSNGKMLVYIVLGLAGLIIGGQLVVNNSIAVAKTLGLSEKIIGLTIVAAGTSLPELVTSVVAAFKKNSDIAIGNVIGSNIFNLSLILGISAVFAPIDYNPNFNTDAYILMGGTTFLLIAMFTGKRKRLDRWEAFLLFAFYVAYTFYLISSIG